MTWTNRIIAILNIIAAGFLFYYFGKSAYKRAEYANDVKQLRESRDGLSTVEWFSGKLTPEQRRRVVDSMVLTDELLERIPEDEKKALLELQAQKEGEEARRRADNQRLIAEGKQPIRIPPRAQSNIGRREALSRLHFDPIDRLGMIVGGPAFLPFEIDEEALLNSNKDKREFKVKVGPDGQPVTRKPEEIGNPVVLTIASKPTTGDTRKWEDIQKMARFFGYEGVKQMYRENVLLQQSSLAAEETTLAEKKAALLAIQDQYQRDLVRVKNDTEALKARLEAERDLRTTVYRENDERRSELTRIYSEMAEAFASRESAYGRLRDAERQLQDARDDIRQLTQENQKFLEEISELETGPKK